MRLIRQPWLVWPATAVWTLLFFLKLISPGGDGGGYAWAVGALFLVLTVFLIAVCIAALKRRAHASADRISSPMPHTAGPEDPRPRG